MFLPPLLYFYISQDIVSKTRCWSSIFFNTLSTVIHIFVENYVEYMEK